MFDGVGRTQVAAIDRAAELFADSIAKDRLVHVFGSGYSRMNADAVRALVAKGSLGGGVFETADCQKTYEELSAKGVTFLQDPAERPYGIEALFRDDSGNWFSLTQPKWLG